MLRFPVAVALALVVAVMVVPASWALEPPTREQVEKYRREGVLDQRQAAAHRVGNHRVAQHLVQRFRQRVGLAKEAVEVAVKGLPSTGDREVFALLIDFADYSGNNSNSDFDWRLFGGGPADEYPYESLRDYYRRSSHGQLEIDGATLGWYTTPYRRDNVEETTAGRESLIEEAINHFDRQGHDFSRYDTDGDGEIDYFLVFWAGPHQEWAEFWWGYQRHFEDGGFTVDGKTLGAYSWQWESWNYPGPFSARVAIHETGHALGLPDYYDYDDTIGPDGGLGNLDMMDGNWGDHNCFSKFLLGWISPEIVNEGTHDLRLAASDASPAAALLMHGDPKTDPFAEYFMVQNRRRQGNDSDYPNEGLLIWHVDARVSSRGTFLYDNSFTDHKLIRLMEADGLEQIEQGIPADAGDFYRPGDLFTGDTTPDSDRYDGVPTNLAIDEISLVAGTVDFQADLGSGCALFCEASVQPTAWPGRRTAFQGSPGASNCRGEASLEWQFGDGVGSGADTTYRSFSDPGRYQWNLGTSLGDASCSRQGEVLVCTDERCWQWRQEPAMAHERVMHAATVLADGRVLVAGGEREPEIFDPDDRTWRPAGPISGTFLFAQSVLLEDGRVLVVGGNPGDPVSAEIFDPQTNSWSVTGQLGEPRIFHSAVRLADGQVLVAGGYFYDEFGQYRDVMGVEAFDPHTESWRQVGSMPDAVLLPGLTLLHDGRVLVTGDQTVTIFDPATERWTRAADLTYVREYHVAVGLQDGRVLVAGGFTTRAAEIFDPATGAWTMTEPMNGFHLAPAATTDSTGRVLVFGGFDRYSTVISSVEIFDPETGSWIPAAPMTSPRLAHRASRLQDETVLITGGMPTLDVEPYRGTTSVEMFRSPAGDLGPRSSGRRLAPAGFSTGF